MTPSLVNRGDSPVILSFPHAGTFVPHEIWRNLNDEGRTLRDTDWHVDELYAGLLPDVTIVRATFHRYVIDANRDPAGTSLYPGQTTTGLVPTVNFDNMPIWRDNHIPDAGEIERRKEMYHAPYHAALLAEMERIRARHGLVVLYDCHSIRSVIPWLFDGILPDLNVGTDHGRTCAREFEALALKACAASGRSHVLNGRFRGGWTVRHYGRPVQGFHAIQMELAQSAYLVNEVPPFAFSTNKAARLRPCLGKILHLLSAHALEVASKWR